MKKTIILATLFALLCTNANAATSEIINGDAIKQAQTRIDNIGFKILNYNGIEKRTVFDFDTRNTKNAYSRSTDRQIVIFRGLYNRLESDDEVAAILAHEISHSVDSYNGIFRGAFTSWSYSFAPKKYEYKADKKAVDYLVNAGYNPVSLIVVMNKAFPQGRYDWYKTHPLTSRRMMEIYEYIYKKYPEYLANNIYKENIYYQNFLLTSKENRAKFQKKIETNSKHSVNYL
jgi:Zn-dependent protease with chaperone function